MKEQTIILKIRYDESKEFEPRSWNWSELLDCDKDCVEVMNYGKAEDVKDD